jgi:hypothetical protein
VCLQSRADGKPVHARHVDVEQDEVGLFDVDLLDGLLSIAGLSLVKPYGGEEGSGYGNGDGRADGPRLTGAVQWTNHPRRRSDGRMLPNAGGLVTTRDGAKVTFLMQGRTAFRTNAKRGSVGEQNIVIWFEADDERYKWLNDAMCVVTGVIAGLGAIRSRSIIRPAGPRAFLRNA